MVAFAAASYVLWFNPTLVTELEDAIAGLGAVQRRVLHSMIETAIEQRNSIGTIGLIGALWSGVWWMSNLREAVSAQWGSCPRRTRRRRSGCCYDLRALVGLGTALVVGLACSLCSARGSPRSCSAGWARRTTASPAPCCGVVGIVLGVGANWLIFAWAITRLPRTDVALRGVRRAALLGAVGFEAIKQGAAVYFEVITGTPGGAVFGSLLGLLLFGYLVARLLLWVTAWAATSRGNERIAPAPVPGPVVLRQELVAGGPSTGGLGAALLLGIAAGAWLRGRSR